MQENVEVVNIVQIIELPPATGVTLDWVIPISHPTIAESKKGDIEMLAEIISEQIGSVTVPDPNYYLVGGPETTDPAAGTRIVNDASLNGLDYTIFKWGVGPIRKGIDWQNDVVGGGWRLLGVDFITNEMYAAIPKPEVSNILSAPGSIARFTDGVELLPSSTIIGASMYRKLLVMNGAEIVTLPLCSDYPVNVALYIASAEGPRKESTIITQSGDIIYGQSGGLNTVYIGQREFIVLITDGTSWYIQSCSQRMFEQPTFQNSWSWGANTEALNSLPAIGTLYNRADYPGTWAFVNKLATAVPTAVVNEATWATNKTKWGLGVGGTTFRVPDMRGQFARSLDLGAGIDPDRSPTDEITPGSGQGDSVEPHTHPASDDSTVLFIKRKPGGPGGGLGINSSSGGFELAQSPTGSNTGTSETRPINAGFYPLILI